jgi:hypothetical protein
MSQIHHSDYGEINVELFQEIKRQILAEPFHFLMDIWKLKEGDDCLFGKESLPQDQAQFLGLELDENGAYRGRVCNTACCIGGWALALKTKQTGEQYPPSIALMSQFLGLSEREHGRVFYVIHWEEPFRKRFFAAKTAADRAQVAADYIDHICGLSPQQ